MHGDAANGGRVRLAILCGAALLIVAVVGLYLRAASRTNHVALAQSAKPVSTERARGSSFRPVRTYIGTSAAWSSARVGPQYVSAYVGTVLVRPGAVVKRGEVLATLDCRNASAATREIAARAKALEQRQLAMQHEAERTREMQSGGFASANELEQLTARSSAQAAEVEGLRASMVSRSLEVDDCVLRAPFAGEVADRFIDPGAYVRPGSPVVTVIDRNQVRIVADAPESDFAVVAAGTPVRIEVLATGAKLDGVVSRRAPSADESTRTIHFEIDVANANHALPVGSTARLTIEVGAKQPATEVPLSAATIRGDRATVFVVEGDVARRKVLGVVGEAGGTLFVDPALPAGAAIVVEGRALLDDGDKVAARERQL
ncbi:MAG: putative Co/Zn/Cd efflux system rane fusion protein [Myxococcales bacterium]|nr:putative Co/Zn/Cd efflux system rane fusion protein [Myxococcales bacterium]